jgi:serine phosphatase RsbU (regulator of sigma subunit)
MRKWTAGGVDFAVVTSPVSGEMVSGDGYSIREDDAGVLLVVIDALGHGGPAAEVLETALALIRAAEPHPVDWMFQILDERLSGTRGAVAAIALISPSAGRLTWASIGDVQGTIASGPARTTLVGKPGILGYRSPRANARSVPFGIGDVLCLATDGVRPEFAFEVQPVLGLETIARRVATCMKTDDDSLAVLAQLEVAGTRA